MLGQLSMFAPDITGKLRNRVQLQIVSLQDVRYMLERFHYLNRVRVGRQINYAVLIDGMVDGVITYAYPMVIGKIDRYPTDQIIEFARLYLHSNIRHTATCAIGKSLKRIKNDWIKLFPGAKEPLAIVSWSDAIRHHGTIYKATNFEHIHRSKPKYKTDSGWRTQRENDKNTFHRNRYNETLEHDDFVHEKDCWIYRL